MKRVLVVALFALLPVLTRVPISLGGATDATTPGPTQAPAVVAQPSTRLMLPSVARDGLPSEVTVSKASVYQAGALQVRVTRAHSGTATVFGRVSTLVPEGDGLVGYVGIGIDDPPYSADIKLAFTTNEGTQESRDQWISILKTAWTVDYIILPPPDPNAPPPPPGLVDEQPRLNAIYRTVTPRQWTDGWVAPLTGPLYVTSYFGEQRSFDGGPVQGHHGGTDLGADFGTPIYATNNGTVVLCEQVLERGNLVVLDHGGGVFSAYGHMSSFAVTNGQTVTKGQVIGYIGSTGVSTGPHLHWEIAVDGFAVDGLRWIDGSQGF
ncbi:MAG TPA: M23 family metallopeptidase [Tepidiformaceae bacterium]